MMCPILLLLNFRKKTFYNALVKPQKALKIKGLLRSLFDSNCNSNSHTNHGVVTCADETHHFCASAQFPIFQHIIALYPSLGTHTLFRSLHCKNLFNEHIVFSFYRCIISRFDVFANRLFDKFTKCLQLVFCLDFSFRFPIIELRLFVYDSSFHIIRI